MAVISDLSNPWRLRLRQASFRGAFFHVALDARASGRRTVLHEYPKRNKPYAEDMGRMARRFNVRGYLIGPDYLTARDQLISALEKDGPGYLIVPFPYFGEDGGSEMLVMAGPYTCVTSQEKGGYCEFEMDYVESGLAAFSAPDADTQGQVNSSATTLETGTPSPSVQST